MINHRGPPPPPVAPKQALRNSRREHQKTEVQHEEAPVFYPTVEEFADPIKYIKSIEPACEEFGLARVVPPTGFGPTDINMASKARFETKLQKLQALGEGTSFEDGRTFTVSSFRKQADKFKAARGYAAADESAYSAIEQDYWDALKGASGEDIQVIYHHAPYMTVFCFTAAACITSPYLGHYSRATFPIRLPKHHSARRSTRTATLNNNDAGGVRLRQPRVRVSRPPCMRDRTRLWHSGVRRREFLEHQECRVQRGVHDPARCARDSRDQPAVALLGHALRDVLLVRFDPTCPAVVEGKPHPRKPYAVDQHIFVPNMHATHRHVEDLYLPSINYLHFGDAKQWYGIPRAYAKKFRDVMAKTMKLRVEEEEDLEHAIVAMISPETLNAHGVPVFKAVQRAGEFIVTFPEAFHCGFSYGFNVGEAANFATEDWIAHGSRAVHDYRIKAKREVFSFDRLLFTLASNLDDLQNPALLLGELERVGMEEIRLRERLVQSGVARMPNPQVSEEAIAGSEISEADAAFDDMRVCHLCQHTCFLSAVVSDSSETQVACPRCFDGTRSSQSAVIEWYSDAQIRSTIKAVSKFVRSHSASKGKRRNKKRAAASLG